MASLEMAGMPPAWYSLPDGSWARAAKHCRLDARHSAVLKSGFRAVGASSQVQGSVHGAARREAHHPA